MLNKYVCLLMMTLIWGLGPSAKAGDPVEQVKSDVEVKIAAAEVLAKEKENLNGYSRYSLQELRVLSGIANGVLTSRSMEDLEMIQDTIPDFFNNLKNHSDAVSRYRGFKQGYGLSKPIIEFSRIDWWLARASFDTQNVPYTDPVLEFENKIQTLTFDQWLMFLAKNSPELPVITHLEMFRILKRFPVEEQWEAHRYLLPKLFTRVDFFSSEEISRETEGVLPEIVMYHTMLSKKALLFFREDDPMTPEDLVTLLRELPLEPVMALPEGENIDKSHFGEELLGLRRRLREFTSNQKWTASDLVAMHVSLNVDYLAKALELTKAGGQEYLPEIKKYADVILKNSQMFQIQVNPPNKADMKSPAKRHIELEKIYDLIQYHLKRLEK